MFYAVITTIQEPTSSVRRLVEHLIASNGRLVVAGDSKGPQCFDGPPGVSWPVEFLSLGKQESGRFRLAEHLPTKHYARKNIAYLQAIKGGATCIYETDDDNAPSEGWRPRSEFLNGGRNVARAEDRWVNVYRYFSREIIWPRGLPLEEIRSAVAGTVPFVDPRRAPIQQGLVNGSPDVDAIWRLTLDREFNFEEEVSVYLEPGNWCPFNTQSTWWWPVVYPLLYIPSYCSFRMCDIWKSFVAQRCLWELGLGVVFHAPEVVQERNPHDLMRDFRDEIPGYEQNREIGRILKGVKLHAEEPAVGRNLVRCYEALVMAGVFPENEMLLVWAWLADLGQ